MDTCPQDALLVNQKALLCLMIILILIVTISTSLTICQFLATRRILKIWHNKTDDDHDSATYIPAHVRDNIQFVNEKQ